VITRLICVRKPDTRQPGNDIRHYQAIDGFAQLLPID
jgi:hypothetical protein